MGLECNLLARMVTEYDNFFILFSHTITASLHENWLEPGLAWKVGMAQRGWRQSGHLLTFSISREECYLKVRASQMQSKVKILVIADHFRSDHDHD